MIPQLYLPGFEVPFPQLANESGSQSDSQEYRYHHDWSSDVQEDMPLKIYTMGRFALVRDGEAIEFGRKAPRRALELLKAIIAMGGRDVSQENLTSMLWPDSEGDAAHRIFDTTLHRLRKLIGYEQALVMRDGRVSLDNRNCWVDVWAFERILGEISAVLPYASRKDDFRILGRLTKNLQRLYQNHFLHSEDLANWSVSLRERLRSKFIHQLVELGLFWERAGDWSMAISCYQKGLDVDDLIETFHQHLMVCYLQTGRYSEGMAVYRHCRQVLSVVLGIKPAPETEQIYQTMIRRNPLISTG